MFFLTKIKSPPILFLKKYFVKPVFSEKYKYFRTPEWFKNVIPVREVFKTQQR